MKQKKLTGSKVPQFTYDTPYSAENDFYALCAGDLPLVMVFLPNFGHPISRHYLAAYVQTRQSLTAGRLACVVRSDPRVIAERIAGQRFPFEVICDAEGVLYDYFEVRQTTSIWDWTFASRRIINAAKKEGYQPEKGAAQLLPLTMVLGEAGQVLFAHRGRSITDLPEDCAAMEAVCGQLAARRAAAQAAAAPAETPQQSAQGEARAAVQNLDWFDLAEQQPTAPAQQLAAMPEQPAQQLAAQPTQEPEKQAVTQV